MEQRLFAAAATLNVLEMCRTFEWRVELSPRKLALLNSVSAPMRSFRVNCPEDPHTSSDGDQTCCSTEMGWQKLKQTILAE